MKANKFKLAIAIAAITVGVVGCGSDDDGDGEFSGYKGKLIDGPVGGVSYVVTDEGVETQSGITGTDGEYTHTKSVGSGEKVTFSIGGIIFPSVVVGEVITPFSLAGTTNIDDPAVINIIQLLMSLDEDGDASNGITISEETRTAAKDISLDFSSTDFDSNSDLASLVTTLVTEDVAKAHFNKTLSDLAANADTDIEEELMFKAWTDGCAPVEEGRDVNFLASTSSIYFTSDGVMTSQGIEWSDVECTQQVGTYSVGFAWNLGDAVTASDGKPAVTLNIIEDGSAKSVLIRIVAGILYTAGGDAGDDFNKADLYIGK